MGVPLGVRASSCQYTIRDALECLHQRALAIEAQNEQESATAVPQKRRIMLCIHTKHNYAIIVAYAILFAVARCVFHGDSGVHKQQACDEYKNFESAVKRSMGFLVYD